MKTFRVQFNNNDGRGFTYDVDADYFIVDENDHLRVMRSSENERDPDIDVAAFSNNSWISIIDVEARSQDEASN